MRIHPWLAALSSVCLLMAAGESSARAQQPAGGVYESRGFDDALEGRVRLTSAAIDASPASQVRSQSPGIGFQPAYGSQDPSALWPPGVPPQTYHPYPQISPYHPPNIAQTTNYNRDGLWFREMLHRDRDYFMTLEYLMVRYRNPGNAIVGARPAPFLTVNPTAPTGGGGGGTAGVVAGGLIGVPVSNYGLGGPAEFGIFTGGTFQRVSVGPGVFPFPFVADDQTERNSALDETLFPIRTLGFFENHFKTDGMRARLGYFDEDGSGLMLTGWFGTEASDRFQHGRASYNGIAVDQEFILNNSPTGGAALVFPRNGALPLLTRPDFLDTGADPLTELTALGFTGITTKFDVLYQLDVTSFAAGGALHWYHEPIYKRKWVTVRPTVGARYQYLDERFAFRGIDSGFGYDLDFGSTGTGGAGNQVTTFRPDADDLIVLVDDAGNNFFFEANLNSQIDSHMAGPEAGIRYDFGNSDHFSIWGQSTFALLANHERINLTGRNIGDPLNYWLVTGDNWADPTDGIDTNFKTTETHTHASPMFEQSVFIEMDVFRYIPVLKNLHVLSDARFRTGYTYTVIGEVARPGHVIEWNSFPDLPRIDGDDRKTWHTHNWSFAIDWKF